MKNTREKLLHTQAKLRAVLEDIQLQIRVNNRSIPKSKNSGGTGTILSFKPKEGKNG